MAENVKEAKRELRDAIRNMHDTDYFIDRLIEAVRSECGEDTRRLSEVESELHRFKRTGNPADYKSNAWDRACRICADAWNLRLRGPTCPSCGSSQTFALASRAEDEGDEGE